jgi:hypothetical protein
MSEKDFAVSVTGIPQVGQASKKPCYLITLESTTKKGLRFVAMDKPQFEMNFIQVKGVYSDLSEDEISKRFSELVSNKDAIMDMMFPAHRVISIRSLVFNANKPSTLVK